MRRLMVLMFVLSALVQRPGRTQNKTWAAPTTCSRYAKAGSRLSGSTQSMKPA